LEGVSGAKVLGPQGSPRQVKLWVFVALGEQVGLLVLSMRVPVWVWVKVLVVPQSILTSLQLAGDQGPQL
jgi:hypothetical protein